MSAQLTVASVCSGIGGAELAFAGLAGHAFAAEVDPFARAVLSHRFPAIMLHGDFTEITHDGTVDVLVGGTPCQSFSVAGLRGGMADERGNLALEFLRLAGRVRARWVLWENVPGVLSSAGGRDFGAFLGGLAELGYGWAYRVLDAQFFGLAQRRKRVFVVGCLGDWRRAAAVLFEPASLRGDSAPRRETRERIAPTLASRATAGGGLGSDFDCDGGLIAFDARQSDVIQYGDKAGPLDTDGHSLAVAFGGNRQSGALDVATAVNAHGGPHGQLDFESETFITHSLRADGFDASEDSTGRGTPLVPTFLHVNKGRPAGRQSAHTEMVTPETETIPTLATDGHAQSAVVYDAAAPSVFDLRSSGPQQGVVRKALHAGEAGALAPHDRRSGVSAVRRLTPRLRECERLQGFPDDWTAIAYRGKPAADGNRYRALGNAFAVPVVRWIARRIAREQADIDAGLFAQVAAQ